jgi:hypothetical protein
MGYNFTLLISRTGVGVFFFLKRGRWVIFFRKGGGRPKKVGNLWSRQCGILNISQPYRPPWPVTGIALLFLLFSRVSRPTKALRAPEDHILEKSRVLCPNKQTVRTVRPPLHFRYIRVESSHTRKFLLNESLAWRSRSRYRIKTAINIRCELKQECSQNTVNGC